MEYPKYQRITRYLALTAVLTMILVLGGGLTPPVTAQQAQWPEHGMICTTNPTSTFTLNTMEGVIDTPDGNVIYMWGFAEEGAPFQHPGPVLCVTEGDTVTIVLKNNLPDDVSMIFPGQENVMANGEMSQPQFDLGGNLTSMAPVAEAAGGSMTYSFVASHPGTYFYESGTEPLVQVNMGLFGALVVRPATHPSWAYNEIVTTGTVTYTTQFQTDAEFVLLLSEIDPMLHAAKEQGLNYNMENYQPRYWMINGRSFPDTIAPNGAAWLPNQPYGSLIHIYPFNDDPGAGEAYYPDPASGTLHQCGYRKLPASPPWQPRTDHCPGWQCADRSRG